jgi:thioesterase domain-containing protein
MESWQHVVPLTSTELGRPLFCIHGAGGNVLNLKDLARCLEPEIRLVGLKASGAEGQGSVAKSIDEICEAYIAEITRFQPSGPLLLGGFSNGGIAAYEIARRLADSGREVETVFLLDTFHPSCEPRRFGVRNHMRRLRADPLEYASDRIRDRMNKLRTDPAEQAEEALMSQLIEVWRDYEPSVIDAQVVLLSAIDTHETWLHIGVNRQWPSRLGIQVIPVPGDHINHVEGPNAQRSADAILTVLKP